MSMEYEDEFEDNLEEDYDDEFEDEEVDEVNVSSKKGDTVEEYDHDFDSDAEYKQLDNIAYQDNLNEENEARDQAQLEQSKESSSEIKGEYLEEEEVVEEKGFARDSSLEEISISNSEPVCNKIDLVSELDSNHIDNKHSEVFPSMENVLFETVLLHEPRNEENETGTYNHSENTLCASPVNGPDSVRIAENSLPSMEELLSNEEEAEMNQIMSGQYSRAFEVALDKSNGNTYHEDASTEKEANCAGIDITNERIPIDGANTYEDNSSNDSHEIKTGKFEEFPSSKQANRVENAIQKGQTSIDESNTCDINSSKDSREIETGKYEEFPSENAGDYDEDDMNNELVLIDEVNTTNDTNTIENDKHEELPSAKHTICEETTINKEELSINESNAYKNKASDHFENDCNPISPVIDVLNERLHLEESTNESVEDFPTVADSVIQETQLRLIPRTDGFDSDTSMLRSKIREKPENESLGAKLKAHNRSTPKSPYLQMIPLGSRVDKNKFINQIHHLFNGLRCEKTTCPQMPQHIQKTRPSTAAGRQSSKSRSKLSNLERLQRKRDHLLKLISDLQQSDDIIPEHVMEYVYKNISS